MLSKDDRLHRIQMWQDIERRVREFFLDRDFIEVRTPILVESPGMEPNLDPMETELRLVNPERKLKAGLITSPEYSMKKIVGSGVERVFTITPVFRNVEAVGGNHLPEFTMLEWYAPGNYDDLMSETEQLFQAVLEDESIWPRIEHKDAAVDQDGEPHVESNQFFLTHYPAKEASLAAISEEGTAQRFEAYADQNGELLELCNGFVELTDAQEQERRFKQEAKERENTGKTVFPIDKSLLTALEAINDRTHKTGQTIYGNAVGLDRLLMLKYRIRDINDIQIIPREERYHSLND